MINGKRQTADGRPDLPARLLSTHCFNGYTPVANYQLLIVCCLLLIGLSACENDPDKVNPRTGNEPSVEEAFNIESLLSQNGTLKAKLVAPYMLRFTKDTSYLEFPRNLHVDFYDSTANPESKVDALYGKYFESRGLVYLRDSVVVFNVKGDTLRTPDLWWDQNTKKFYSDKVVRLRTIDKQIWGGKGFSSNQDLTHWEIYRPTGTIGVPDSMSVQQ